MNAAEYARSLPWRKVALRHVELTPEALELALSGRPAAWFEILPSRHETLECGHRFDHPKGMTATKRRCCFCGPAGIGGGEE